MTGTGKASLYDDLQKIVVCGKCEIPLTGLRLKPTTIQLGHQNEKTPERQSEHSVNTNLLPDIQINRQDIEFTLQVNPTISEDRIYDLIIEPLLAIAKIPANHSAKLNRISKTQFASGASVLALSFLFFIINRGQAEAGNSFSVVTGIALFFAVAINSWLWLTETARFKNRIVYPAIVKFWRQIPVSRQQLLAALERVAANERYSGNISFRKAAAIYHAEIRRESNRVPTHQTTSERRVLKSVA